MIVVRSLILFTTLMSLIAAGPTVARERETPLARALSCRIGDGEIAKLMDALVVEDAGMKSAAQVLAAPSGNLYRLTAPVSALGYSTNEIYISPGRILMVVSGEPPDSVSSRLQLTPVPYSPAERRIDDTRKIIAYQLSQSALAGKVLVGCEYGDPAALTWLARDEAAALLAASDAPTFAQEQDRAGAPNGERRCPAGAGLSIGGENFGPGDVAQVEAQFNEDGMPVAVIELSDQGHARFVALQEGRVGDTLPICLGDALLSDPYLAAPITGSSFQIAGAMTAQDTMALARRIREQLGLTGQ